MIYRFSVWFSGLGASKFLSALISFLAVFSLLLTSFFFGKRHRIEGGMYMSLDNIEWLDVDGAFHMQ